jgi:hypothetical protein
MSSNTFKNLNNNIDIFKKTIDNYSAKINELENIKTNIN